MSCDYGRRLGEVRPGPVSERELKAQREHTCPRCHIPRLNRCRAEDGTLLEHPHPERVKLVKEGCPACGCDPDNPWYCGCGNENCPCNESDDENDEEIS